MALLLVRSVDGDNDGRYMNGDIVSVHSDDHQFGRMESLDVWVSEGRDPSEWPGGFVIVKLEGLDPEHAMEWLSGFSGRRDTSIQYHALERRLPSTGRDTLRTNKRITRRFSETSHLIAEK